MQALLQRGVTALRNAVRTRVTMLYTDYKNATTNMLVDMRANKIRSLVQLSCVSGVWYLCATSPSLADYESEIVAHANVLHALPQSMRNKTCSAYLDTLNAHRQHHTLIHHSFGVFSLVFAKVVPDHVMIYGIDMQRHTWAYSLFTLPVRFLDVGFHGRWLRFEEKMVDFDVAED
eukprot:m.208062 g.208062  ORF g.208062 m.208062 type:complete len:175 (+) comp53923_c0_seq1:30-554(+)